MSTTQVLYQALDLSVCLSKKLRIDYGDFNLGHGITLIKGANGTGKTTLLNTLSLMLKAQALPGSELNFYPHEAKLELIHGRFNQAKVRQQYFGHLSQQFDLLHNLTAFENIAIAGLKRGLKTAELFPKTEALITRLFRGDSRTAQDILNTDSNAKSVADYSGGQKLRIALARALIADPPVLLIDEPTNNMDEEAAKIVVELLLEQAQKALAVIIVTHEEGKFHRRFDGDLALLNLQQHSSDAGVLKVEVKPALGQPKPASVITDLV